MPTWEIFVAGCVGAMAPEVVRLYRLRNYAQVHVRHIRRYILVSVLFVALGGAVAVLLEANSLHAAFYMGASLPALVSAAGGQKLRRPPTKPVERSADQTLPPFGLRSYLGALFYPD